MLTTRLIASGPLLVKVTWPFAGSESTADDCVEPFSKLKMGRAVPPDGATASQPGLAAPGTSRFTSAAAEPAGTTPPVIVTVRVAPAATVPVAVPSPLRV